jgi:GDP-L-fucose synthase
MELLLPKFEGGELKELSVVRSGQHNLADAHEAFFAVSGSDVCIHLAAEVGGIGKNQQRPADLGAWNAVMGLNVLDAMKNTHRETKLVMIGTCCSYPKQATNPLKESSLWNGYPEETNAPYGIAKRMLITMAQAYRQQYGLNAITLIPANLYGPGDNFDLETSHVIPALIRKAVEARNEGRKTLSIWGTGTPTREFLHVRDAARAIVMATERYDKPEPVNIGTGKEISIYQLAKMICQKVGFTGKIEFDTSKPDGQPRRCLDVSRAKREFGFEAEIELSDGLDETIAWYESQAVAV